MKIAVSVPDPVFARAEQLAGRLGLTRSRLYALALEHYLDQAEEQNDPVTEALNRVYDRQEPEQMGAAAARGLVDAGGWEW